MAGKNSIQFLRGTETALANNKDQTLLDGQPLYDKTNNWLCIGDGGNIESRQTISMDFNQDALTDEEVEDIWGSSSGTGGSGGSGSSVSSMLIENLTASYIPYFDGTVFKNTKLYPDSAGVRVVQDNGNQVAGLNWNGAWSNSGDNWTFMAPGSVQMYNSAYRTYLQPWGLNINNANDSITYSQLSFPVNKGIITANNPEGNRIATKGDCFAVGWTCIESIENLSWTSTAGLSSGHSGFSQVYTFQNNADTSKKMLIADIYVTTQQSLGYENNTTLIGGFTQWSSAFIPLFAAVGGTQVLSKYGFNRLEITSYSCISDTDTNIGRLNGNGMITHVVQSNTTSDGYWYPYVRGVLIELDSANKSKQFSLKGEHVVCKFYNFMN